MHIILWRFEVAQERVKEFQSIYGSSGDWAKLFGLADGYCGTELLQASGDNTRYITIDRWQNESCFQSFQQQHGQAYRELDARCEGLTIHEDKIGTFLHPDLLDNELPGTTPYTA
jgi:heme-degrading monooxygenase HmoA